MSLLNSLISTVKEKHGNRIDHVHSVTQSITNFDQLCLDGLNVNVCKSPLDLPKYDVVISGTFKEAQVKLSVIQAASIVVIAQDKTINMITSSVLYNTEQALQLFTLIRHQLTTYDYDVPKVIWATPNLVSDLNSYRSDAIVKKIEQEQM